MCVLERIRVNLRAMSDDGDENASRHFFTFSMLVSWASHNSNGNWDNAVKRYMLYRYLALFFSHSATRPRTPHGTAVRTREDGGFRGADRPPRGRAPRPVFRRRHQQALHQEKKTNEV